MSDCSAATRFKIRVVVLVSEVFDTGSRSPRSVVVRCGVVWWFLWFLPIITGGVLGSAKRGSDLLLDHGVLIHLPDLPSN